MAKFRFSQEKQVVTWVRDYFYVEAETLDEAIAYLLTHLGISKPQKVLIICF